LVIVGVIVLFNVVGGATSQSRGLADDFTQLVIAGDTDEAFDYLDPELQVKISKQAFEDGVAGLKLNDTCKQSYNDVKVSSKNGANSADIAGLITCDGDRKIELSYRFEGRDELKLVNLRLRPQE
jgi:phosphopantothenate synthetase